MADVTISAGNVKMKDSPRVPATIRVYALSDFNLADGTPIQASSPYNGGNAYKSVALTPSGSDPTVYAFSLFTIPATEDAAVNPNTARWGFFLFDGSTTPRLITHVSGLASARVPVTPTPTTLAALALYNGGSLAPVNVDVSVTGDLTVAGLTTLEDVVINGTLNGQGIIGGAGVVDRLPYWTDSDTLGSSPLIRLDSETTEHRGSGGATKFCVSAGYVSGSDYTRAAIYATGAVVIYGIEQAGSSTARPVRLASYNDGVVQFGDHDNVWFEMTDSQLLPKVGDFAMVGHPDAPFVRFSASIGIGNGFRFCSGTQDVAGLEYGGYVGIIKASGGGGGRGTIQIGDTLEAKPTADVATRGLFWFDQGGAGVADTVEIVRKTAADVYEYANILAGTAVKVYRALLTQTGTSAPVATVLENSVGAIVLSRTLGGRYALTLAGAFPAAKVFTNSGFVTASGADLLGGFALIRNDNDSLGLITTQASDFGTPADDILTETAIEILVFP